MRLLLVLLGLALLAIGLAGLLVKGAYPALGIVWLCAGAVFVLFALFVRPRRRS